MAELLVVTVIRLPTCIPQWNVEEGLLFSLRIANLWNRLPDDVVALESVESFKSALHICLGERLFEFD